jgi:hypothetical protein
MTGPKNCLDMAGFAITQAKSRSKSFIITIVHGEGLEPPTYWV